MITQFPDFRPITIESRETIEKYTSKFDPYSDFNFFSLFAWDTTNERLFCELNGNLVVLITEYNTEEPLLSFLGNNKPTETALSLLKYAEQNNLLATLRYIPEISTVDMDEARLIIQEDRGDFDYIFSVSAMNSLVGKKYKNKRQLHKWFISDNPDAVFVHKDISCITNKQEIEDTIKQWEEKKQSDKKDYDLEHEIIAIDRLLQVKGDGLLKVFSVVLNGKIIAFSIDEILSNGFAISHFSKADTSHRGVNEFLNTGITNFFLEHGVELWNWEQDLDLEGLRYSKMLYRPVSFLKKFRVELKNNYL